MSKLLDRVSKLLNQAERAPEGSPEREAFMAKAIVMAQANAIDLAVARAHQAKKEKVEEIEERKVQVGDYVTTQATYAGKRTSNNTKWLSELLTSISPPNDVNCLISHDRMFVYLVGFPSDLEVVERLYASLAVQMISEADKLIKAGAHKDLREPRYKEVNVPNPDYDPTRPTERWNDWGVVQWDNPKTITERRLVTKVDGREFRSNFYQGFINRVSARLWDERRKARTEAGVTDINDESNSTAVALRDKEAELKQNWEERTKFVRSTVSGPSVSSYIEAGIEEGQRAGARAGIGREARVDTNTKRGISA